MFAFSVAALDMICARTRTRSSPTAQRFGIRGGRTPSLQRLREEAEKCILLCSNCHVEVESGVTPVPAKVSVGQGSRRPDELSDVARFAHSGVAQSGRAFDC